MSANLLHLIRCFFIKSVALFVFPHSYFKGFFTTSCDSRFAAKCLFSSSVVTVEKTKEELHVGVTLLQISKPPLSEKAPNSGSRLTANSKDVNAH